MDSNFENNVINGVNPFTNETKIMTTDSSAIDDDMSKLSHGLMMNENNNEIGNEPSNFCKIQRNKTTKPNLINAEQRSNNKIKLLKSENARLRDRIVHMEKLLGISPQPNENDSILKSNQFEVLIDNMDDSEETNPTKLLSNEPATFDNIKQNIKRKNEAFPELNKKSPKVAKTNNAGTNQTTTDSAGTKNVPAKKVKPPPIHIHNQAIKDTLQLMKGSKIENFEIKRVTNEKHSVLVKSIEDYTKTSELLKEVNTQFFTYTPKNLKPKSLVLKGLTEEEDMVEIKQDLEQYDGIKIQNIIQMNSRRSGESASKLPLYIVQFEPSTNMSEIIKIKTLNYQRVVWEALNKQNNVMQCRKCQRFGHAASNCNLMYRCVKCDKQHSPGECSIKNKVENVEIYCANCQKMGHPASFRGCPIYQQMLLKLKSKIKEKKMNTTRTFESIPVNAQNGSYADMLKANKTNNLSVENLAIKLDKMAQTIQQQSEQISQLLSIISSL